MKTGIAIVVILLIIVGMGGCSYNGMNRSSKEVDAKWASVQSQYQRRADLIPNLVATVKGAANFEKETYVQVAQARAGDLNKATQIPADQLTPEKVAEIQKASTEAMSAARMAINIAVERYPDLKATANFTGLQSQLEGTENRINVARDDYNNAAKDFNVKVSNFPNNIMAKIFGMKERTMFEADKDAKNAPKVEF